MKTINKQELRKYNTLIVEGRRERWEFMLSAQAEVKEEIMCAATYVVSDTNGTGYYLGGQTGIKTQKTVIHRHCVR